MGQILHLHNISPPKRNAPTKQVAAYFKNAGYMDGDLNKALGPYGNIEDVWKDQPCYIVGCGPSLKNIIDKEGWEFFDNKHTIGINHVIEDYDGFEWFLFLDQRFLTITTYDIKKFKGRVFVRNTVQMKPSQKVTVFKTKEDRASISIEDGLYSGSLSGLAAVNLALLTGANPIYLCGFGMVGDETCDNYHYKSTYTGETKDESRLRKYKRANQFYLNFSQWKHRVKSIGTELKPFDKISLCDVIDKKPKIKIIGREPKIAHLSFSGKTENHADITRAIISDCYGVHSMHMFDNVPKADLYILEHFMSTKESIRVFPHKMKSINLVHSTNCWDYGPFLSSVCLTETWKQRLSDHGVDAKVIKGGVDLNDYKLLPDYPRSIFGRITRWSPGKIPKWWAGFVDNILTKNPQSECLMFSDLINKNPAPLQRERMYYDKTVKIYENKNPHLAKLSVYVHANGTFRETMSHAVIEAMATGLPIVYLYEGGVIEEVVGDAGIKCMNQDQLERELSAMLNSQKLREEFGARSLERANVWDIKETVRLFDEEIKSCLDKLK